MAAAGTPNVDGWRKRLKDILLGDADNDMLYSRQLDGFENDDDIQSGMGLAPMGFAQRFEPFNTGYSVPPCARSSDL